MGASVKPETTYSPDNPFAPKGGTPPTGYSPDNPFAPRAAAAPPLRMPPVVVRPSAIPQLAPRDVSQTLATSDHLPNTSLVEKLGEDLGPELRPQPPALEQMARQVVQHPLNTAASMLVAPLQSAASLGKFAGQKALEVEGRPPVLDPVSGRDAALAAAQLGTLAIAGPAEEMIGPAAAPLIGSRAAGVVARTVPAAAIGAAYNPEHPVAGAVAGGTLGALANEFAPARPTVRRLVTREPGAMLADETTPRAVQATGRVLETPPLPEGPDFTVEQNAPSSYSPDNPFAPATGKPAAPAKAAGPGEDLLNDYQQSEIGQRERVNNATEDAARRAQFPMTVTNLLDHAEAKGTSIAQSAATLRRAGYTIPPEIERDAVKQQMRAQPSSEPAYSPENPFATTEKTDLFGNAVAPTVEQGSLLSAGAGTEQSRIDQRQLARKDQAISPEEMAQRRDVLGAPKPAQPAERVVSAAIRTRGGRIFQGPIHLDALNAADRAGAFTPAEQSQLARIKAGDAENRGLYEDGFLTSSGRFVPRAEATRIAEESEQSDIDVSTKTSRYGTLGARDLANGAKNPAQEVVTPAPKKVARPKPLAESARYDNGDLRPAHRVSDEGLLGELVVLTDRREAAAGRSIYRFVPDENFHTTEDGRSVMGATPGPLGAKGPSMQASAMKNLADFDNVERRIRAELVKRGYTDEGIDDQILARYQEARDVKETTADAGELEDVPFERSAPSGKIHMETSRGSRSRATSGEPSTPIGSAAGPAKRTSGAQRTTGAHPLPEAPGLEEQRSSIRPLEMVRQIKQLLNPESLGSEARGAAGTIGHEAARSWRQLSIAQEALRDFGRYIGKLPKADAVRFWDAAEHGRSTGDARADQGNALLHQITEQYTKELIALDRLKANAVIANYIGRFWATKKTPVRDALRILMGKRPFEGPKSFEKHRSLVNFTDGLDAGLVPQTYNYVDAQLAKIAEMQRVIAAEKMLRQEAEFGRAKKVMTSLGHEPPVDADGEKWVRIDREGNDPAFTIYLPPEVSHWEAVDTLVYGKLSALVKQLNVLHRRAPKIGRDALGYARGDREIVTKFGGAEGVLSHELGHILDARYGLRREIERGIGKAPSRVVQKGKRAGQSVPDYKAEPKDARGRRKTLKEELRQLANLRRETMKGVPSTKDLHPEDKKYLHSWPEKMANMVEAYIHARPRFKKVAPGIFEIFDRIVSEHPELHGLRDIEPSLAREEHTATERLPGFPIGGYWYAPRNAAAVWRNHLSRGLRGNPLYDAYMAPAQAAQQLMLGLSGFHATVIASEGAFSELALAADNLINKGKLTAAGERVLGAGAGPVESAYLGRQVMQEYRRPGTHPELADVLDAMIAGGYRGKATSEFWTGERIEKFKKALHQTLHNDSQGRRLLAASKLPFDAVWAAIETTTIPVLAKYVPFMKTGAFYHAAQEKLDALTKDGAVDVPLDVLRREMRDLAKEMDYRFGQVDYDNFFINNAVKNLAQMIFLAPGWTFGTVALAARGVSDIAKLPVRAVRRMRYTPPPTEDESWWKRVGEALDQHDAGQLSHDELWDRITDAGKIEDQAPGEPPPELLGKSAAYWIFGAVLGTVIINGVLTFINTGERPKGKDFWAFRDGSKDAEGNANRQTIPGYLMKDIYGWSHHPVDTFRNKLSPTLSFLSRVATNRTYSGDEVYDEHASVPKKARQIGKELLSETAPLSVQNYLESRRRGEGIGGSVARNAFGITPVKREFQRTDAQNLLNDILARRGHTARTPDEREQGAARSQLLHDLRAGTATRADVKAAEQRGEIKPGQGKRMLKTAKENPLVTKFKQLSPEEAKQVFEKAEPWEKALWAPLLRRKQRAARRVGPLR